MPNISEMNQELVRAFNTNLCCHNIAFTNLTVQNLHGKDHIVISFDKNMDSKQCVKYLNNVKEKIIKRSYRDEKAAGVSYNLEFFPFAFNTKHLPRDDKGRKKFSVEIDEGVIFNLKCYLAQALAGDIQEDMGKKFGVEYAKKRTKDINFDRNSYLLCMRFDDWELKVYFINSFLSKIGSYENAPRDHLEIIGNCVYIKKSIFDDIEFIKDIEAHDASLICRDFEISIKEDRRLESLKFPIIDFIHRMGIPVYHLFHTSYKGSDENSVLIPIVAKSGKGNRLLDDNDAYKINSAFNMEILSDVSESISARLPKSDSSDGIIYGIDFADVDIACCVMNKIMESSVINAKHELSIDPELRLQALSPVQSPVRMPNGPSSGLTELSPPIQEFPMQGHGEELKRSPRRELEEFSVVLPKTPLDIPGTSGEFLPWSHLSSSVTNPHSSKCVSAVQNVQAGTSAWPQPINPCSSLVPSAGPSLRSQSGTPSWKSPNSVGAQPMRARTLPHKC